MHILLSVDESSVVSCGVSGISVGGGVSSIRESRVCGISVRVGGVSSGNGGDCGSSNEDLSLGTDRLLGLVLSLSDHVCGGESGVSVSVSGVGGESVSVSCGPSISVRSESVSVSGISVRVGGESGSNEELTLLTRLQTRSVNQ